jgi:lysophospholipase L1-like esterase
VFFSSLLAAALLIPAADPPKNPFEFADGDRVVFLGGTLVEREQKYGYWELALTLLNKDKRVSFRNLGWSGDTVWCESRGSFDGPKKGYDNTIALLKELKPTVIVICYGHVESFDGAAGVSKFTEGLERLIDGVGVTKARVVLMPPTPFENVTPMTDAPKKNDNLKLYTAAIKDLAERKKLGYFELNGVVGQRLKTGFLKLTDNGFHLSELGYRVTSDDIFPGSADGPKAIREAIVAKNELFFHRWRPQNHTYLFGFRKHEQGNNAKEVAEFDPLVSKAEAEIAELLKKAK